MYDQDLIFARVIGLPASSRKINFGNLLAYELAAYPPSMFNPGGEIKIHPETETSSDCIGA